MARRRFTGRTAERGTTLSVVLTGELDLAGQPQARELLSAFDPRRHTALAIDLTALEFCDSTSVTLLLAVHRRAAPFDVPVRVTVLPDGPVHRVLALVGADHVLDVRPLAAARERRFA